MSNSETDKNIIIIDEGEDFEVRSLKINYERNPFNWTKYIQIQVEQDSDSAFIDLSAIELEQFIEKLNFVKQQISKKTKLNSKI